MGKNDKVLKGYFRDKNRFADLFNGVCFVGKQVIVPTDLEEASGHYAQTENVDGGKVKRQLRDRDIIMRLKSGETLKVTVLLLSILCVFTMEKNLGMVLEALGI